MSMPNLGSGSMARSAPSTASPAISSTRSPPPASRFPHDRPLTPCSCALRGDEALQHFRCDERRPVMGQYHHPVCIEAEEGLDPHALGCGLKEGEQGFTRPRAPKGSRAHGVWRAVEKTTATRDVSPG